jgi:hypothetical protein
MMELCVKAKVNEVNPYKMLVDELGKEKRETLLPRPSGATALREWDGATLARRVDYDSERDTFVMEDEVCIDREKQPKLYEKFKELTQKKLVEMIYSL